MDYLKLLLLEQEQALEQEPAQTERAREQRAAEQPARQKQPALPTMPDEARPADRRSAPEPQSAAQMLARLELLETLTSVALPRLERTGVSPAASSALPPYAPAAPTAFAPLTGGAVRPGAGPEALSRFFERDARRYG